MLKGSGISVLNSILATGRGLPVPKHVEQEFGHTRLFTYDEFLMVETDPHIEKTIREYVVNVSDRLQKEVIALIQS